MRTALSAAITVALAVLCLTGCDAEVSGSAAPVGTARIPLPSDLSGSRGPMPGQCLETSRATTVDCVNSHDAEVILFGTLPATVPAAMPDEASLTTMALPVCRSALVDYLGGLDADATSLVAQALWPNAQGWARGERWLLCTVTEVGFDERPKRRTGSLRGALRGDDILRFQTCSLGSPSRDPQIRRGACDAPHFGEALPGVFSVGRPTDPMPPADTINRLAQQRCPGTLNAYLGGANPEVLPAWRIPNAQSWARGYTNVVCYAEPIRPVRVRLRGLGANKLPG